MKSFPVVYAFLALLPSAAWSFTMVNPASTSTSTRLMMSSIPKDDDGSFELFIRMPPREKGLQAQMKIASIIPGPSELIEVRYALPFGLDVAPQNNLATCTKDGTGGEKVGDILRYSTQWTMGLPRGDGMLTTAASFAGGLSWQCNMFDVTKAQSWDEVVEALTSNVPDRTDEVVLIFERAL